MRRRVTMLRLRMPRLPVPGPLRELKHVAGDIAWAYEREEHGALAAFAATVLLGLMTWLVLYIVTVIMAQPYIGLLAGFIFMLMTWGAYRLTLRCFSVRVWVWTQDEPSGRCYRYVEWLRSWYDTAPEFWVPVNGRRTIHLWAGAGEDDPAGPPMFDRNPDPPAGNDLTTLLKKLPPMQFEGFEGDPHFGSDYAQPLYARCMIWEPQVLREEVVQKLDRMEVVKWGVVLAMYGGLLVAAIMLPGLMHDMAEKMAARP